MQCCTRSASVGGRSGSTGTTTAQHRSPRSSSGSPITATSRTSGCCDEHVLDLFGADVLAFADDDVLQPAGDRQLTVVCRCVRDRPCATTRRRSARRRRATRRDSRGTTCRPAPGSRRPRFGAADDAVEAHDAHLRADHRAAVGGEHVVGIAHVVEHQRRALGEPVTRYDVDTQAPPARRAACRPAWPRRHR